MAQDSRATPAAYDDLLDGGEGADLLDVRVGANGLTVAGGPCRDHVALAVLGAGRGTRGLVDHAREQFVVRWTCLGTPGADEVTGRSAYTARGRGGDDELRGTRGCEFPE